MEGSIDPAAFRSLLTYFTVDSEEWAEIREAPDSRVWSGKLEAEPLALKDQEHRTLKRLQQLSLSGSLTGEILRRAIQFLDNLAGKMDLSQRQLEGQIVK